MIFLPAAAATWSFVIGGDVMLNGISAKRNPLGAVAKIFRTADLAYANLEVPLTNAGTPTTRKTAPELRAKQQFILRADPAHIRNLGACGLDFVSLGNNHAMDYGVRGLRQNAALLSKEGIQFTGAGMNSRDAEKLIFKNVKGLRVGMLSFLGFRTSSARAKCTPAGNDSAGVAELVLDRTRLIRAVKSAKRVCDFLVVAMHWGAEKKTVPDAYQVAAARAWIEAGADLIIGSHPHVLEGAEIYRGKLILYSMGNLASSKPGATALVRLRLLRTKITSMEIIPASISGGRVALAKRGTDFSILSKLIAKKYRNRNSEVPAFVVVKR